MLDAMHTRYDHLQTVSFSLSQRSGSDIHQSSMDGLAVSIGVMVQDPGDVNASYNGPLSPGWLHVQWIKIDNITNVLTGNPYYTSAEAIASGGGFGLRSANQACATKFRMTVTLSSIIRIPFQRL